MKRQLVWLAAATAYASPHVFSVSDDLLAYPQAGSLKPLPVVLVVLVPLAVIRPLTDLLSMKSYSPTLSSQKKTQNHD